MLIYAYKLPNYYIFWLLVSLQDLENFITTSLLLVSKSAETIQKKETDILTGNLRSLCSQITLLYANVSPDDILLKQKLDVLQANHPNLKVTISIHLDYFTS